MPDIVCTPQVAIIRPDEAEIYPVVAVEDVVAGQPAYQVGASGKYGIAGAADAGKQQARGIFLQSAKAGQAVDLLKKGLCAGYTIVQAYDTRVFLSNTLGAVADAAGAVSVPCGRVVGMSDAPYFTKVIAFDFDWVTQWS